MLAALSRSQLVVDHLPGGTATPGPYGCGAPAPGREPPPDPGSRLPRRPSKPLPPPAPGWCSTPGTPPVTRWPPYRHAQQRRGLGIQGRRRSRVKPEPGLAFDEAFVGHRQPAQRLLEPHHLASPLTVGHQSTSWRGGFHPPDGMKDGRHLARNPSARDRATGCSARTPQVRGRAVVRSVLPAAALKAELARGPQVRRQHPGRRAVPQRCTEHLGSLRLRQAWARPSANTGTESPVRERCDMIGAMSQRREGLLGLLKHPCALLGGLGGDAGVVGPAEVRHAPNAIDNLGDGHPPCRARSRAGWRGRCLRGRGCGAGW